MAKRVSVINFKGGVGKTTLSFNLTTGLTRYHGAKVLLVDVDHQSSLSIVCLGANEWTKIVSNGKTVDAVFRPFIDGSPFPGTEIIYKSAVVRRPGDKDYSSLDLVPASLQLDDVEIDLTASHHGNAIQSEWDKRTLICRWLQETGVDDAYDYIIFDCPPATKIVSQNAIAASHGYIVPVIPEAVMERGAPHLVGMIGNGIDKRLKALATLGTPRPAFVPDTKLVGVVITRIQEHGAAYSGYTDDHTQHLGSLTRRWGTDLVEPYIPSGTGVSQSLSASLPIYELADSPNVGGRNIDDDYRELTKELKKRIDSL
ncbi:MAG: ParA family protein [Devosia sp.]|uniref:ParA family protein n=1 Tax=Devosia sp. TaxID=1871048 RepID=UPI001AC86C3B|nr:ParA family protein [Devosia sp.]MBN9317961.1 ParA family protein [Devosia sp.]